VRGVSLYLEISLHHILYCVTCTIDVCVYTQTMHQVHKVDLEWKYFGGYFRESKVFLMDGCVRMNEETFYVIIKGKSLLCVAFLIIYTF